MVSSQRRTTSSPDGLLQNLIWFVFTELTFAFTQPVPAAEFAVSSSKLTVHGQPQVTRRPLGSTAATEIKRWKQSYFRQPSRPWICLQN